MRFEQEQRFILANNIFWGYGHLNNLHMCVEVI